MVVVSANPKPFLAWQMKSTRSFSLTTLIRRHPSSWKTGNKTEGFWAWNHSTFGRGEPKASQHRVTLVPGNAPTNVGSLLVNLGGSEKRKKIELTDKKTNVVKILKVWAKDGETKLIIIISLFDKQLYRNRGTQESFRLCFLGIRKVLIHRHEKPGWLY